jgi:hypothetical protein
MKLFNTILFCLSYVFTCFGQVILTKSNLPIIIINTNDRLILDEPKIEAQMKIIDNGLGLVNNVNDVPNGYDGPIGIELRGSTSQGFPKLPYGFETRDALGEDKEFKLLGMPKESDWIFNASYNDKSLMRDALALIFSSSVMEYAPKVRYHELVINNEYQGVYLLVEKIKRDKNRVDIAKLEATNNEGDVLTGGYIIKLDKTSGSNSDVGWDSSYPPFPNAWQKTYFQIDYPKAEDLTEVQKKYIKNHIDLVDKTMAGNQFKDAQNGFRKYIDQQSLIDYIIINELTKNPDAYRLSTYFYKERDSDGGKIKFGPAWDFNLAFGNVDYCTQGDANGLVINDFNQVCSGDYWVIHFWWEKFLSDELFYLDLKKRWKTLRDNQFSNERIHFVVDSLNQLLSESQVRNFNKWPILNTYVWPNYFIGGSYKAEVDHLKDWINKRLQFLDQEWSLLDSIPHISALNSVSVVPNPATTFVELKFIHQIPLDLKMRFYDMDGSLLYSPSVKVTEKNIELDIQPWPAGMIMIHLESQGEKVVYKFLKQ